MPLSVLVVSHYFATHGGGVEAVAWSLIRGLTRQSDLEIRWWASDCDPCPAETCERVTWHPVATWNGIERWTGAPIPIWSLRGLGRLWSAVGAADVVHVHDALYMGNIAAWLFARLRAVPVVLTQHIGTVPYRSTILRHVHRLANKTIGRWILSTANQVVFISPAVLDEFARYCRFARTPCYWANGVDADVFQPAGGIPDDPTILSAKARGRRILLFAGRFVEKKGLHLLRQLATEFRDDLWLFAGSGPLDPDAWGLPNVCVVRGVSGERLAEYYRCADLLILPSRGEGFPLVVQESMACGTPVLVSSETAAGCPSAAHLLLTCDVGGTGRDARWLELLRGTATAPETLHTLRPDVAAFARGTWSWETVSEHYLALFRVLAGKGLR